MLMQQQLQYYLHELQLRNLKHYTSLQLPINTIIQFSAHFILETITIFFKSEGGWVAEIVEPLSELTKDNHQEISQIIAFVMFAKNNESDAPITVVSRYMTLHTRQCLFIKCTDHKSATQHLKLCSISVETVRPSVECSVLYTTPSNN